MRVLILTFDPPTGSGGIEGRTMAYTKGLLERSIYVEVASLSPRLKESEELYQGTRLIRASSSISKLPKTFSTLVKRMSRSSLDTVFILSGGSTPMGVLVLCFCRLTGRKTAVFFYGRDILQSARNVVGRVFLLLSILLAEGVATNSRYTASLLPFRPRSPLTIIYPGVDSAISGVAAHHDRSTPRVLFVGRLVRRKGADLLLSAFQQLRPTFPDLRLDIVGDGPEERDLRALAERLGLGDSVTFWGALYGPELWARFSRALLLVMPSRNSPSDVEGFGTVFLEAGAFGIPSVGTRVGGIPEAVIDAVTGKLVESENVAELARAIKTLLENPEELERLGKNAKRRASGFSWYASTDRLLRTLGK
jgi:phosphatidyl-myo-inositol dimannoside synthase